MLFKSARDFVLLINHTGCNYPIRTVYNNLNMCIFTKQEMVNQLGIFLMKAASKFVLFKKRNDV
jgi:hypothetical protein